MSTLTETGISRPGFTFIGWNTQPDGSGTAYAPGTEIILYSSVTLYAQWVADLLYTITYNANCGIGAYADIGIPYGTNYIVLSLAATGISRPGCAFTGTPDPTATG